MSKGPPYSTYPCRTPGCKEPMNILVDMYGKEYSLSKLCKSCEKRSTEKR